MDFTYTIPYQAAPEQVYAMLMDPDFRVEVCEAQEVLDGEVSVEPEGATTVVEVSKTHSTDGLPSFAQSFVGASIDIVQREVWDSPTHATIAISIPGKPGQLLGDISLTPDGAGTTYTVNGVLSVNVPFVGAKLEELVAGMFGRALKAEGRTGGEWLAR